MAAFNPTGVLTDPDQLSATIKLTNETLGASDEVFLDTTPAGTVADPRTIGLAVQGTLGTDGVTLKTLYSFLKDLWKTNTDLIKFPFPMTPITDEQFEFTNGWNLDLSSTLGSGTIGQTTDELIRTGGWAVNNGPGTNDSERWANVTTLGILEDTDQVYYRQVVDISTDNTTNFFLTGRVDQAIQYYSDTNADGTPDYNYNGEITVFIRSWAKTYAQANLADIGVTSLNYQAYRFPLTNAADVKVTGLEQSEEAASGASFTVTNATWSVDTATLTIGSHSFEVGDKVNVKSVVPTGYNSPTTGETPYVVITGVTGTTIDYAVASDPGSYTSGGTVSGYLFDNMSITWNATSAQVTGFNDSATSIPTAYFKVTIDADVAGTLGTKPSAEYIYTYVQAALRKTTDIDANTGGYIGKVVPLKLQFIGDDLYTLGQSADFEGVNISDYSDGDINRLHFWGYGSQVESSSAIASAARATNVVTVTTSTTHGFTTGDVITIADVTGGATDFNGTFSITVTSTTEFTYAQTGGDESADAATGTASPAEYTNITFPFVATLTINFGQNLIDDNDAIYKVFFTNDDAGDNTARDFGTKDAIVVQDKDAADMAGSVSGSASVIKSYAYDTNDQRGTASKGKDAPITAVAIGLGTAQYVLATSTITRSTANSVSLVAPLERNYDAGTV